ncbi:uncharacterized protein I206_100033 [Kwoniella pini CBS 10737]|uniref:Uncharacterized protein n=1 Tax=Kwoniella pini CBS 10737 TaxID=1296096 RepID=A0A1B9HSF6_9TREE|nr:uncharacterized protein I206_07848 [Kwoniella pini CBS 10737]OCF46178.1 hypothetical protein I206_07848 [Kwoniella pini CBS 10737]
MAKIRKHTQKLHKDRQTSHLCGIVLDLTEDSQRQSSVPDSKSEQNLPKLTCPLWSKNKPITYRQAIDRAQKEFEVWKNSELDECLLESSEQSEHGDSDDIWQDHIEELVKSASKKAADLLFSHITGGWDQDSKSKFEGEVEQITKKFAKNYEQSLIKQLSWNSSSSQDERVDDGCVDQ